MRVFFRVSIRIVLGVVATIVVVIPSFWLLAGFGYLLGEHRWPGGSFFAGLLAAPFLLMIGTLMWLWGDKLAEGLRDWWVYGGGREWFQALRARLPLRRDPGGSQGPS